MQRFHQLLFVGSLLAICWLGMMAVHETGHVLGAWITGGVVERIVLHPLSISRTDVRPNPAPAIVVWMGPLVGAAFPVLVWLAIPKKWGFLSAVVGLFAGFCLIANGAYIGFGSIEAIGDCREMLRTGSPLWTLVTFGAASTLAGLLVWHRLGSPRDYLAESSRPGPATAWSWFITATAVAILSALLSPR